MTTKKELAEKKEEVKRVTKRTSSKKAADSIKTKKEENSKERGNSVIKTRKLRSLNNFSKI